MEKCRKNFKKILMILNIGFIVSINNGCKKDNNLIKSDNTFSNPSQTIVFGQQYNDPYSIQNMTNALESLIQDDLISMDFNISIRPTHLYVKFNLNNWNEYDSLTLTDRNLQLYNFPYDREILNQTEINFEIDTNLERPDALYGTVPINYLFKSGINHEIIRELYFPEDDEGIRINANYQSILDYLVDRAEQIANPNLYEQENLTFGKFSWKPSGRIMVHDDEILKIEQGPWIALRGVQVRVRRWGRTETCLTNEMGYFQMSKNQSRPVNYAIFYQRKDFDIRSNWFGQAWFNGPKKRDAWNLNIDGQSQKQYAHIFQAAEDYYYSYLPYFNIGSPPKNSKGRPALKIGSFNWETVNVNGESCPQIRLFGFLNQIRIFHPSRKSSDIYSTTIHELGHLAHWWQNNTAFNNGEGKVVEGWARLVQYEFTNYRYKKISEVINQIIPFNNEGGWQMYNKLDNYNSLKKGYTPFGIDLMDQENQRANKSGNVNYPNDDVSGFTLPEIWNACCNINTFSDWKKNLQNLNRTTQQNLDELYNFYNDIK